MKSMMRFLFALTCLPPLICTTSLPASSEVDPREIMEKVDARDDGDNMQSDVEMILIDKNGYERRREIKVFVKDKGRDTHRIQFFLAPSDVKDTAFLTYDYYEGEKDDDQWLYLPDLHKTKRIATSDKSSAFMGSDFSYADMTDRVVDEWNYRLLKEDVVDGHKVWLIEALPISDEVRDRYGYKKSILFVRQDIFVEVRAIHLLQEGQKVKYMEVTSLELIDDIWVATERTMKTTVAKRTTHRTVLRWNNVSFNNSLKENFFSVRQLEKGL
jgi:hypothetical protein